MLHFVVKRGWNMAQWVILMVEAAAITMSNAEQIDIHNLPASARFLLDFEAGGVNPDKLGLSDRLQVTAHVATAGMMSIITFGAFGLGLLGTFSPREVFACTGEADPVVAIVNRRQANTCCICLCRMTLRTKEKTPCGHCFHKDCLKSWGAVDASCPICRAYLQL
jgi:hypothetical protein